MSLEKSNSFGAPAEDKDKILNFIEQHGYLFDNEILEALVKSKKNNICKNVNPISYESQIVKLKLISLLNELKVYLDKSMYEKGKVKSKEEYIISLIDSIKCSISENFNFISLEGVEYYKDVHKLVTSINKGLSHIRVRIIPGYVDYPEEVNSAFEDLNGTLIHLLRKLN